MERNRSEILPLTGLRFFAALSVVLAHILPRFVPLELQTLPGYLQITRLSSEGMTLFFVLSGFVIHYNYSASLQDNPKAGMLNFFVARFARLWPLYLVFLFLGLGLNYILHRTPTNFLETIPYYLTLTQTWFYKPVGAYSLVYQYGPILSLSWSISTEWFFYFCYPLICFGLIKFNKIRDKLVLLILISLLTISAIFLLSSNITILNHYAANAFGPLADYSLHNQDSFFRWLIYFSPYSRITEFLFGCIVAAIYLQISSSPSKSEEHFGLALTGFSIISIIALHNLFFMSPHHWFFELHRSFGFAPSCGLLLFCCARYKNSIVHFISHRFFLWGGEISYSLYLLHATVISLSIQLTKRLPLHPFIKLAMTSIFIAAVASLSYKIIEVPCRRLIRRRLFRLDFKQISLLHT